LIGGTPTAATLLAVIVKLAPIAVPSLTRVVMTTENTVLIPVTSPDGTGRRRVMTKEQFEREKNYGVSMAVARIMLAGGIISDRDYRKIDTIFKQKYQPIIGTIYRKKP
jgi:hypothetical protein